LFAVHQLLLAIAEGQIGQPVPLPSVVEVALENSASQVPLEEDVLAWIALLDHCATPALLRTALTDLNPSEAASAALVRYFHGKPARSDADRERVDWLITYIFKERQRDGLFGGDVESELPEIIPGLSPTSLGEGAERLLRELQALLEEVLKFGTFQEMNRSGLIAEGRSLKKELHEEFFHLPVLAAVVNYNLVLGRRFDTLLAEANARIGRLASLLERKDYNLNALDFARVVKDAAATPAGPVPAPAAPAASDVVARTLPPEEAKPSASTPVSAPAPAVPIPPVQPRVAPPAPAAPRHFVDDFDDRDLVRQQMKEMGLDPLHQALRLDNLLAQMAKIIQNAGTKMLTAISLPTCHVAAFEWELRAVTSNFPESDKSFRAEFNRLIRRALAMRVAVRDEWVQYDRKRGTTEYLWKAHYDALVWLLFEGRYAVDELGLFAKQAAQRGLAERASQIRQTAEKLEASLAPLDKMF
jgi:hypothetical protein